MKYFCRLEYSCGHCYVSALDESDFNTLLLNSTFLLVKKALKLFKIIEVPNEMEQEFILGNMRERGLI